MIRNFTIHHGHVLEVLRGMESESVHCVVTSPPYWGLRDYGVEGQIGMESSPDEYTMAMVEIFHEVKRVLRKDGTCWLNLGDSYCGYWGDAKALAEGRASSADTNGWTNGFNMNSRPSSCGWYAQRRLLCAYLAQEKREKDSLHMIMTRPGRRGRGRIGVKSEH